MLFKAAVLEQIARGRVRLALRRWRRPTVKSGGRLRTAAGVLLIGDVSPIAETDLTDADAAAAGYPNVAAALMNIGVAGTSQLYRIEIAGIEPDGRIALRDAAEPDEKGWTAIRARFAKWDATAPGYHLSILEAVGQRPGVAAALLAAGLGREKATFKRDVRKLKELGLTVTLEVGYRLSARGEVVLSRLKSEAEKVTAVSSR